MSLVYTWLCSLQVQFYTEKVRDEMISKDTINEITKNKKEAIEQKKKIVRYKEEEILYMKTEIINDQDKLIELLTLQLLSSNGLMNCRGLLEELLREIHEEKKVEGNFNATNICNKIGTEDHDKQGKFEMILIEAAEKVVNKYKGSDLHRSGGGEPNEMYHYIYHQLSTGILEDPHYGMEVGRIIACNSLGVSCYFRWQFQQIFRKIGKSCLLYWRRALE